MQHFFFSSSFISSFINMFFVASFCRLKMILSQGYIEPNVCIDVCTFDKPKTCVNMAFQAKKCEEKNNNNGMETAATAKIQEDDHFRTGGLK